MSDLSPQLPPDFIVDAEVQRDVPVRDPETGEVTGFKAIKMPTLREAMIIRDFMKDYDKKACAKRMGMTITAMAGVLQRAHVKAEIQKRAEEQFKAADMDQQWVLNNLRIVVERCMDDEKFDAPNALRGLELVGKRHAMFTDKVQTDTRTVIRIESNVGNVLDGVIDVTPKLGG